jgi:hypothetical protein
LTGDAEFSNKFPPAAKCHPKIGSAGEPLQVASKLRAIDPVLTRIMSQSEGSPFKREIKFCDQTGFPSSYEVVSAAQKFTIAWCAGTGTDYGETDFVECG